MKKNERTFEGNNLCRISRYSFLLAFLLTSTGCSQVPEYANPIEWFNDTKAWITGEDHNFSELKKIDEKSAVKSPAFPKLESVPQRPKRPSPSGLKKMAAGLAADRASARYSDKELRAKEEALPKNRASKLSSTGVEQNREQNRGMVRLSPRSSKVIGSSELGPSSYQAQNGVQRPATRPMDKASRAPVEASSADQTENARKSIPSRAKIMAGGAKSWGDGTVFAHADKFAPRFPPRPSPKPKPSLVYKSSAEPALSGLPIAIVYFGNSSSVLNKESKVRIMKAFELYKRTGRGPIHVIGHASSRTPNLGPTKHQLANFNISNRRANSVVRELIRLGVDPRLIFMSGMSDHRPAFLEVMPAGEAGNRRAEIYFDQ